jgi:adenylate cyclase
MAYGQAVTDLRARTPIEAHSSAESLARRAIALDPADAEAHSTLAGVKLYARGDYEGALAEAQRALALSPNLASAHGTLAQTLIFSGQPEEGLVALERSIRLDPHNRMPQVRLNLLTLGLYFSRKYEASAEVAKRALRLNPEYPLTYRWLAAALGQLGRTAEAKETLERAIEIAPASFDQFVRQRMPWHRPEDYAHMLEGLRKAGWQET